MNESCFKILDYWQCLHNIKYNVGKVLLLDTHRIIENNIV